MFTSVYLTLLFAMIDLTADNLDLVTKLSVIVVGGAFLLLVIALGLVITAMVIRYQDGKDSE